jgi:glutamate N-acetyltransferase/amino-acid N-acetyltransferase
MVFGGGAFHLDSCREKKLTEYLKSCAQHESGKAFPEHGRKVEIRINLNMGTAEAVVIGSDLSLEYIHVNADYRT